MAKNWSTLSPSLGSAGYFVFALNYGETNGVYATAPVAESAQELAQFVNAVRAATGSRKVNLVGHSQGGMMPRYYMGFLGGAKYVRQLIGIAPSNHGTEGVIVPLPGLIADPDYTGLGCAACADQQAESAFMQKLNSIGDTVAGPSYTVISTVYDEVVIPYNSQFLNGPAWQVTNITIQDKCPADAFEHDQTPNDPVVHRIVAHALGRASGPADPPTNPAAFRSTLGDMLGYYFRFYEGLFGRACSPMHDPLAASLAVGGVQAAVAPVVTVDVDTSDGPGRGQTTCDLRGPYTDYPEQPGARCRVVLELDGDFAPHLVETLVSFL